MVAQPHHLPTGTAVGANFLGIYRVLVLICCGVFHPPAIPPKIQFLGPMC